MREAATGLLADHQRHCVATAIRTTPTEGERAVDEITDEIRQLIRL